MTEITSTERQLPAIFKPEEARIFDTKADAIIEVAAAAHDWEMVASIAAQKAENLQLLVAWRHKNVRGKGNPLFVTERSQLSVDDAEQFIHFTKKQIERLRKKLLNVEAYCESIVEVARRKGLAATREEGSHQAYASGVEDWYTPGDIIECARRVLGEIDLDPASSEVAQKTVRAKAFFTVNDNGLEQDWHGRVWLNPPYRQPYVREFVSKLVSEYEHPDGGVSEAVLLTNNGTDTEWFQLAASRASGLGFTLKRVRFHDANGDLQGTPLQGQAIFYFGNNSDKFRKEFSSILWFPRNS